MYYDTGETSGFSEALPWLGEFPHCNIEVANGFDLRNHLFRVSDFHDEVFLSG
jgi:hypothetical protein